MSLGVLLALIGLAGCEAGGPAAYVPETDLDQDGVSPEEGDCDDQDASVFPGQRETWYDGVDQDCDGNDDDRDGDGVAVSSDCDDVDPSSYPGASERCDGVDNDCDGQADEDPVDGFVLYTDTDRDDWGAGDALWVACEAVDGTTATPGDCDDLDPNAYPGASEVCDGRDNDCDGTADNDAADAVEHYPDADGDGFGAGAGELRCEGTAGWAPTADDCDDKDALVFAGAEEWCDGEDNDCDGTVDEDDPPDRTYYADEDGDGWGDELAAVTACGAPSGFVEVAGDCDDGDGSRLPGATEVCDGLDNDCNYEVDDDPPGEPVYYPDVDGDGFGDTDGVAACSRPDGALDEGLDCDDDDPAVYPGTTETCDHRDNDCDGATDEPDALDASTWYRDADYDGYGVTAPTTPACWEPYGWSDSTDDCDDGDASVNPGRPERCDEVDNDCDGLTDEDAVDAVTWYTDADGDGHGAGEATATCDGVAGDTTSGDDCDDGDPGVSPGAAEADNGQDDDCDVLVDEDFVAEGDLVVAEVARQPYAGGSGTSTNYYAGWFEVYNASGRALALDGWFFGDAVGNGVYVAASAGVVVSPGARAVLCYDDAAFADPSVCDYTWADPAWGDGGYDSNFYLDRDDDLVVVYAGPLRVDQVHWTYDDENGYWPRTATYSMELSDDALGATLNDDLENWCIADASDVWSRDDEVYDDHGTPGEANGVCP